MIKLMKKRLYRKLRKSFTKNRIPILLTLISAELMYFTVVNFERLHNGASVAEVNGRKYSPVVSELIVMVLISAAFVFALKLLTKFNVYALTFTSFALLGLIVIFGLWAFQYTHIDPKEGFLTVAVIVGSVGLFTFVMLWYERFARSRRKKKMASDRRRARNINKKS